MSKTLLILFFFLSINSVLLVANTQVSFPASNYMSTVYVVSEINYSARGIAFNSMGEAYIAIGSAQNRIPKILANGTLSYINTTMKLTAPVGIVVNKLDEVLIAEGGRVYKMAPNGTFTHIAGTGTSSFNGDGKLATLSNINPYGLAINSFGEILIADRSNPNHRIRKILLNGTMITLAGNGVNTFNGDGIPATTAGVNNPLGVAINSVRDG